jgi:hypothetical protein
MNSEYRWMVTKTIDLYGVAYVEFFDDIELAIKKMNELYNKDLGHYHIKKDDEFTKEAMRIHLFRSSSSDWFDYKVCLVNINSSRYL